MSSLAHIQILVIARQAGSAHAFTPLVKALKHRGAQPTLLALDHARRAWQKDELSFQPIDSFEQAYSDILSANRWDIMLTGTSEHARKDARFWEWAQTRELPTLGWVDSWGGYQKRFTSPSGPPFDLCPEHVGVVDTRARQEIIEAGCPQNRVHVVGHPGLAQLSELPPLPASTKLPEAFQGCDHVLLYVSSALQRFPEEIDRRGFSDQQALEMLANTAARLAARGDQSWGIGVKRHPRESPEEVQNWFKGLEKTDVYIDLIEGDRLVLPRLVDVVAGTVSILLLESSLMGTPVLSLQPGRKTACGVTDNRPNIDVVVRPGNLGQKLSSALDSPSQPPARNPFLQKYFLSVLEQLSSE